jgi:hypothetical protein
VTVLLGFTDVCISLVTWQEPNYTLFDKGSFIIPYLGSLMEVKYCMLNEISLMAILFAWVYIELFNSLT